MRVIVGLPEDWDLDAVASAVGRGFIADRPRTVRVSFLDTFDWRVASAGCRLSEERCDGRRSLRWQDADGSAAHIVPIEASIRFPRELPDSVLRARLEGLTGVRALLAVGEIEAERWSCRVRDAAGNTTLLLDLERASVLDASGAPAGGATSRAELRAPPGFEPIIEEAARRLGTADGAVDLLDLAARARGRRVGDYSSKLNLHLDAAARSDDAVRTILLDLLATLKANVDGVIADHDTEFLHDLRVATRRTRAVLSQLRTAIPADTVSTFGEEFRWLGSLTGPCRDLDVFLLEMDSFRRLLGETPDVLDPLERLVEEARSCAFRDVRRGLRSARFRLLVDRWESWLEDGREAGVDPPDCGRPIGELAAEKIHKAHRRIRKRARRLGADPHPDALHRLRIDGKKLRYLLEFFRNLFARDRVEELIRELKNVQDLLGAANDVRVQQNRLVEFAHGLAAAGEVETVLAMGRLTAALRQRAGELRLASLDAASSLASAESRTRYDALVSREGC